MATRGSGLDAEAEPVEVELDGQALRLTFDDGADVTFDVAELERAIDGERAPGAEAEAA